MGSWLPSRCAVCGDLRSSTLFDVHTPSAPGGQTSIVRCVECGLVRLTPQPDADEVRQFYGSDYYAYAGRRRSPVKQRVWDTLRDAGAGLGPPVPGLRAVAQHLFDVNVSVAGRRGLRVVDVGCGYGDLLAYLATRGCDCVGVEFDEAAAEAARAYGVDVRVGELSDLALPDDSVDAIVLQHSLEHVPDPRALLREIGRIAKPGATLHVALPNGAAAGLQGEREAWGCLFNPEHFWYFDRGALARLLESEGFAVAEVRHRNIWVNHWRLWRAEAGSAGVGAALRRALRFALRLLTGRGRADLLRVVAVRRA